MEVTLHRRRAARSPPPPQRTARPRPPHALPAEEVLASLGARADGLGEVEARSRLDQYGANVLPRAAPVSLWRVIARQFASPLIYVLLLAAAASLLLRDVSDAGFILAVLAINAAIGTAQEFKAEQSAQALQTLIAARALVVRGGEEVEVDASEIVPGDVIVLEGGNRTPADARLLWASGLEVDESLLTGESLPILKRADELAPADAVLGDRRNLVFGGTLAVRGRAHAVVFATGAATEVGKIAGAVLTADAAAPPLMVRMKRFTRNVALAVLMTTAVLGSLAFARGEAAAEVLFLAIALAVSAIPEGLPVALTVALGIAVRRMSRRNVIARRLVAVEALGSCTFIASDKTGTLTLNELTARSIALPQLAVPVEVTVDGPVPEGTVRPPPGDDELLILAAVQRVAAAATLCNDGFAGQRPEGWAQHGDAVDVALLVLGHKAGVHKAELEAAHPRLAEIPFEAERRFAATLHRYDDGDRAMVKGAAERVLEMCSRMAAPGGTSPLDPGSILRQARRMAASGLRVIGVAEGPVRVPAGEELGPQHLDGLTFLGLVGMIDPLRPEAVQAVRRCRAAGVEVAMVTGDHPITARALARELGMCERGTRLVTGVQLAAAAAKGPEHLDALVRRARVFARVEPQQKLQIVASLIRLGHFVAVTGDGANDAPALKAANIGVAMGKGGTDVARETSELILVDDNFASIVAGIEEGRIAYANVRKVIFLLVSTGAAELLLFVLSTAFGLPLPLLPAQLLWLNLVTNGIQDVALAFEPAEGDELNRPPRPPRERIFNRLMIERTLLSAAVIGGVGFGAWSWMLGAGWSELAARNVLLLLLVLFENVQAMNSRSEAHSLWSLAPFGNKVLLVGTAGAQLVHIAAMYVPGLRDVLEIAPVPPGIWVTCLGLALSLLVALELHKLWSPAARRASAGRRRPPPKPPIWSRSA